MSLAAIVLAAGSSTRFGHQKQLALFRGHSLVSRTVASAMVAHCTPIVVIAGKHAEKIRAELSTSRAVVIENPNWEEGIGSSVRAGVEKLRDLDVDAVVVMTCDQPFVSSQVISSLKQTALRTQKPIVASAYSGTIGIPALFRRSQFAALLELKQDRGAKQLMQSCPDDVATVDFPAGAIDIDTPDDFARLNQWGR